MQNRSLIGYRVPKKLTLHISIVMLYRQLTIFFSDNIVQLGVLFTYSTNESHQLHDNFEENSFYFSSDFQLLLTLFNIDFSEKFSMISRFFIGVNWNYWSWKKMIFVRLFHLLGIALKRKLLNRTSCDNRLNDTNPRSKLIWQKYCDVF